MSIQLLCKNCVKLLKLTGFDSVNEVGRKHCAGCGDNQDNLVVVNAKLCDEAIDKWNNNNNNNNNKRANKPKQREIP